MTDIFILLILLVIASLPYLSQKYTAHKKYQQLMDGKTHLNSLQQEMRRFIQKVGNNATIDDFFVRYTGFLGNYNEISQPIKKNHYWVVDLRSQYIDFLLLSFDENILVIDVINKTIPDLQEEIDIKLIEQHSNRGL